MDDLIKELQGEYNLSRLRMIGEGLPRSVDREKYQMIRRKYRRTVQRQVERYQRNFETRRDMALKRIAERKGYNFKRLMKSKNKELKAKLRRLDQLAARDVHRDHLRRIAILKHSEARELEGLIKTVRQRQNPKAEKTHSIKLLTDGHRDPERQIFKPNP